MGTLDSWTCNIVHNRIAATLVDISEADVQSEAWTPQLNTGIRFYLFLNLKNFYKSHKKKFYYAECLKAFKLVLKNVYQISICLNVTEEIASMQKFIPLICNYRSWKKYIYTCKHIRVNSNKAPFKFKILNKQINKYYNEYILHFYLHTVVSLNSS